jgi:transposase
MKQNPDKTDYGDARLLADLLRVGYLPKVWLAPEEIRRLRRLVRFRVQLVDHRRNVKLRIRALLRENRLRCPWETNAWTVRWLRWVAQTKDLGADDRWLMDQHLEELAKLNDRIREVEARLEKRADDDAMIRKLRSFRGIGLITAVMMRAEIGRFDRFDHGKQLARFCGLSPRNASSGERQSDAGLIRAGNPQLRNVLIQLGQRVAYRPDGRWAGLVHRLLKAGKPKNVVVAAVANRYVRWLYHQMQPEQLAA